MESTSYNGPVYMNNGLFVGSTESESNIIFNNDVIINGSLTTNQGSVVINKATFKQESTNFEGTLTLNGRQVVTTDTVINDIGETTTSLENLTVTKDFKVEKNTILENVSVNGKLDMNHNDIHNVTLLEVSNVSVNGKLYMNDNDIHNVSLLEVTNVSVNGKLDMNHNDIRNVSLLEVTNVSINGKLDMNHNDIRNVSLLEVTNVSVNGKLYMNDNDIHNVSLLEVTNVSVNGKLYMNQNDIHNVSLLEVTNVSVNGKLYMNQNDILNVSLLEVTNVSVNGKLYMNQNDILNVSLLEVTNVSVNGKLYMNDNDIHNVSLLEVTNVSVNGKLYMNDNDIHNVSLLEVTNVYVNGTTTLSGNTTIGSGGVLTCGGIDASNITGTSTTQTAGDNSTKLATTAYADTSSATATNTLTNDLLTGGLTYSGDNTYSGTTTLSGTANIGVLNGTNNLAGNVNINTANPNNNTTIGNSSGGGQLFINGVGNFGGTTNLNGVVHATSTNNITLGNSSGGSITMNSDTTNIGNFGLSTTGSVSIASGINVGNAFAQIGSATLNALYLRSKSTLINDDGGTTYIGNGSGSVNITGAVNATSPYNFIAGSESGGEVQLKSKKTFIGTGVLDNTDCVSIASGDNNKTGSFAVLGSATLGAAYMRGRTVYINDTGTGNTNIGNLGSGSAYMRGRTVYINDTGTGNTNIGNVGSGSAYMRGRTVYINDTGTGNTNIGNDGSGSVNITTTSLNINISVSQDETNNYVRILNGQLFKNNFDYSVFNGYKYGNINGISRDVNSTSSFFNTHIYWDGIAEDADRKIDEGKDHESRVSMHIDRSLIVGGSIFVLSDERIKTNVSHIEDSVALNLFRKLQPKTYHYKDFFEKGTKKVFGYMAQEVKEILPHAVSLKTECIPNIYELATINDNTMEFHNFNTSELEVNASSQLYPKCKVYTKDNKEEYITIKEIIDEKHVLIENISSSWLEDINVSTGEIIEGNKLFIYGQEVDNFHTLNKNVIWTVASAALQEVDREVQTEKQKVSQLENKVSQLENTLQELLLRINTLEHK